MKPLKLIINAFGPYIDKTEIDFTKFDESGIYLITGDTGAGKTTIFDALSFVLFGEASGSIRNNPQALRSDFAKEDNITFVELEFLCHGDKFKIRRECGYKKLNSRGNYSSVPEKAVLGMPNNETISSLSEVNFAIKDILGIDKNQFSQIVMIAQGEFQKFLNAQTKDRIEIFRKIFGTDLYEKFQRRLADLCKAEQAKGDDLKLLIAKDIDGISADETMPDLLSKKNEVVEGKNIYNLSELLKELKTCIEEDDRQLNLFEKDNVETQKLLQEFDQRIKEAEIIAKDFADLAELQNKLPMLEQAAKDSAKIYKEEKDKEKEREKLAVEVEKIKTDLTEYKELGKFINEKELNTTKLNNSDVLLKNLTADLESINTEYENNKKEFESLKDIGICLEKNQTKIDKFTVESEKYEQIKSLIKENENKKQELEKQKNIVLQKQEEYNTKKRIADDLYNKFINNQAGFIAATLEEGEKCPVCGSTHHPHPAKLSKKAVSQEEWQQAKGISEKYQEECTKEKNTEIAIETNIKSTEKILSDYAKSVFKLKDIDNLQKILEQAMDENAKRIKELEKEHKNINTQVLRKYELEKYIQNFEHTKKALEENIKQAQFDISIYKQKIASLEATINEKNNKLCYKTEAEAAEVLSQKETIYRELKEKLEKAESDKNFSEKELSLTNGQIKELTKKVVGAKAENIEELQKQREEKQAAFNTLQKIQANVFSRHNANTLCYSNILKSQKELEKVSGRADILETLSRTANGTLKDGKMKISFESYILAAYFDEIIRAANIRFKEMTSHQYELRRNLQKGGNGQVGLDLDIFDSYTAKIRNVSTLSGGESFKAALALSLGLSDIVQQQTGGIQIETMFIDEGFGSLDPESLEQTIKILNELSGNKTQIGIISHVAELREKIEQKIVVTKTPSGSYLKMFN